MRRWKTLEERFREKYVVDEKSGCWRWTAYRNADGYGKIGSEGRALSAHRVSYELFVGPLSDGVEVDHLCDERACVNPEHLEAVPHRTNVLRGRSPAAVNEMKTVCPQGHPYDSENTYRGAKGERICLACKRRRGRDYMRRRRAGRG